MKHTQTGDKVSQAAVAQQRHKATVKLDTEDGGCMEAKYGCLTDVAPSCGVVLLCCCVVVVLWCVVVCCGVSTEESTPYFSQMK